MKKINILIILAILLSIPFMIDDETYAEGSADYTYATDTLSENAIFTEIDENGNTIEVDSATLNESGIVGTSPQISFFSSKTIVKPEDILIERGVVNFRTKSSGKNTEYTEAQTGKTGYTNGTYAADGAYLGHNADRTQVKFMLAGVIGWVDASEVQVLDFSDSSVKTLSKYYVKNGRLYHGIVTNLNNSNYTSSIDVGPKPSYLTEGATYYSYDGHYFYNYNNTQGYITMLSDYRNDTRENSVNPNNPYYNYYQFLPHRSLTAYTAEELDNVIASLCAASEKSKGVVSKMRDLGESLIENQNKYGTNALLVLGVAANESAWGTSNIAQTKNNLFGHAAYDSDPEGSSNKYSTPAFSVYYHCSTFISQKYCYPEDWRYNGTHLGDKASGINIKYASDPYWGEKAAAYCWKIDKALGGKDSYKYTLAIKDVNNYEFNKSNIKKEANSSSTTLYSTITTSNDIINNYPIIVLDSTNDYYKIQSDAVLNEKRTGIVMQDTYLYDHNYAYISKNNVTVIYTNNGDSIPLPDQGNTNEPVIPTTSEVIAHLKLTENDGYLTGFTLGSNISNIISNIKSFNSSIDVTIKDKSSKAITSGTVATGMTISITAKNSKATYTCVIRGDVSGDGKLSALDYVKIRNHLDKATTLKNAYLKAADVDNNGKISALDYVKVRNHLDGKSTITQ